MSGPATPKGPAADGIVIRRAAAADAEAIHAMVMALADDIGKRDSVASTPGDIRRHGFGPAPDFEALIAEADGAPVGLCLFFTSFSSWRGRSGLYVQDLYVAPRLRGGGLGRRLLGAVAAIGLERGATYLRLSVDADNDTAQAFYRRLGLHWSDSERIFQIGEEDLAGLTENIEGDGI